MVKKTIILVFLYFFCSFTLLVCVEKNILANLTNSQEPESGFFGLLGAVAARKNTKRRSRLGKNEEQEPLEKSQEPEPLKN